MDPDRVRSYLQVACAGLGFDIGEVWWMSNENGTSTVASITESSNTTSSSAAAAENNGSTNNNNAVARPKKRFLQLYTSKAYCNQRSKLVQPHNDEDDVMVEENECVNSEQKGSVVGNGMKNVAATTSAQSSSLVLHNSNNNNNIDDDEHVLSPRIVEAVTKSAQVVWANSHQTKQQKGGLLGRSDIKLQTAIGMPVGMDDAGHVWVVVMFSPKNIESSSDAIEYLQYIGRSAGSSSIPCLLPVVGGDVAASTAGIGGRLLGRPKLIDNGEEGGEEEEDKKMAASATVATTNHRGGDQQQPHYLVSIKPPSKNKQSSVQHDLLGEGVTAKFVSFNIQDDDDFNPKSKHLNHAHQLTLQHPRTSSINSVNDLRNAPKDDFGIPMLPGEQEENNLDNILITDAFDEASYGVWSTIMNSASGNTIRTSTTIASKMETIRERLEEFLCAFLGMSVFDVGDAWVLSSADGENGDGDNDKRRTLKCLFTVAATENNPGINAFRAVSGNSSIQIGDGAVGKAFCSGYPVWSSDKGLIYDCIRYQAMEDCNIETVFAVPIFSAGDVSPSCILSCYSLLHADSVPFVVNFVQKAVRLLWDGLDQISNPHESVGKVLWNNVGPSDLGEMAADLEMQKAFIGKKRPHSDVARPLSIEQNDDHEASRHRGPSLPEQMNGISNFDNQTVTSYPALPAKGLSPAPLFPTTVMSPHSQQMLSVNFLDDGHWAVQQAVKSVTDVHLWNSADSIPVHQQSMYQQQEQAHPSQLQPLQYHPEFTHAGIGNGQQQYQQASFQIDAQNQTLHQQPNYSLAHVDYGVQSQEIANHPNNQSYPSLPAGIHIDPPPVIQANLMEFNAMAQMYSNPETTHPPNNSIDASMQFCPIPAPQAPSQPIENISAVPLSHADSVFLTGPQQMVYCTATSQPVYVDSMDQDLLNSLDTTPKECRITGCSEKSLAKKPYCSKHCGNRICERDGCTKHAQGATRFCIAHGGGRRCTFPGCDKGARDRFFCAAHGGGKRCKIQGCSKSAVGGSEFCTSHGGGKRCMVEGCDKSAQSSTNFCVKHGGGKKCQFEDCEKVARGKTLFCAAHGGGVRCKLEGCNRVAIGKAQLCRAHGGGASKQTSQFMYPSV